jgi:hypothetical protein
MADLFAVAGAKIYIGAAMAAPSDDVTEATFAAVSWTQIKDWMTCGEIGDARALITTPLIDRDRDTKQKGTANAGSAQMVLATNTSDPGQQALIAAGNTKSNYPVKIEWDDAPEGGTPTTYLFMALIMSSRFGGGGPNTVRSLNGTMEINSNIVDIPAAP